MIHNQIKSLDVQDPLKLTLFGIQIQCIEFVSYFGKELIRGGFSLVRTKQFLDNLSSLP